MPKICYIFPGQGAQYVGMGKDLYDNSPEAKKIFDSAEEILPHLNIKKICFEGPLEELTLTANSQVAILVASIASLKAFMSLCSRKACFADSAISKASFAATIVLGLSLGELTALVAGEAIEFSDAVRLVRRRGELMEEASLKNPGKMASILGLSIEDLKEACKESGAEIANLNCPGHIVLSGTKKAIESAMVIAKKKGAKKCIPLNVSGPFHSSLMKEAAELFRIELEKVKISIPKIPIVSNVTAGYEKTPSEIKENLVKQLYSPVLWEDSIRRIASDGCDIFFEIGPGKVLKGLLRRIDDGLKVFNIEKMEDMNNLIV